MSVQLTRRLFTVTEYHQMAEAGILEEDDRIELIEGEIVEVGPIGWRHHSCVMRFTHLFANAFGQTAFVSIQGPLILGERTEVDPDVVLLRPRADDYRTDPPSIEDVLLIVEVGDSSVRIDRQFKGPLYARSGISDLWLVDLAENVVTVHRDPTASGYQSIRIVRRGETIAPLAFPNCEIAVDDILN